MKKPNREMPFIFIPLASLLSVALLVALVLGGITLKYIWNQEQLEKKMVKIVKSKEAKKVFEEGIKNIELKALTEEGVIHNYKIDYDSVKHNPMGGINVTVYVNGDRKLYIFFILDKDEKGKLEGDGGGFSAKLYKLLEKKYGKDYLSKEREAND